MQWNGEERRRKAQDHDTLVEVVQIIKNHVENFDLHRIDYKEHKDQDNVNFKRIDRNIYYATGIVTAVVFFIRIIFK